MAIGVPGVGATVGTAAVEIHPDMDNFKRRVATDVHSSATQAEGSIISRFSSAFATVTKVAATAAVAIGAAVGGAFAFVGTKGIQMNAELETATLQFTTLMGSAEGAEAHVKGLFEFAAKTPFETGPIVTASKHMQTFGGTAFNTSKNLTLIGDAAAATNQNIDEVAFWMGRAYSMIQGGKPFGEAAMRLQEMGIVSPQVRDEMEALQKSGGDAAAVWALMEGQMTKFTGAMAIQATSWKGLMSTLSDVVSMNSAKVTSSLFESLKGLAAAFIEFTDSPAWASLMDKVSSVFGGMSKWVDKVAEGLKTGGIEGAVEAIAGGIGKLADESPLLSGVLQVVGMLVDVFKALWPAIQALMPLLTIGRDVFLAIMEAVRPFIPIIAELAKRFVEALVPAIMQIVEAFLPLLPIFLEVIEMLLPPLIELVEILAPIIASLVPPIVEVIKAFLPLLPIIAEMIKMLLPPLVDLLKLAAPLIQALAPVIVTLVKAFAPILPILAELVAALLPPLVSLLSLVAPILKPLMPLLVLLAEILSGALELGLRAITALVKGLSDAFTNVVDAVRKVWEWFGKVIDKFKEWGNKIPDWLKPGSPTPLELGLRGIVKQMKILDPMLGRMALPVMNAPVGVAAAAGGMLIGSRGFDSATIVVELDSKVIARKTGAPLVHEIRAKTGMK